MELKQLIRHAASIVGSEYKLAQELEATPQRMSDWKHGRKPVPLADVLYMAKLADLSDHELRELLDSIEMEKHAGTPKGERLAKMLGKALAGAAATLCIFGTSALVLPADSSAQTNLNVRLDQWRRRILEMLNPQYTTYHHIA